MKMVILDPDAEDFRRGLESKFPEVSIHAGAEETDVADSIEAMDILIAKRISDEGMKKALRLQWIQALTTGVDVFTKLPSLRKEVLITSTRGIHGPQMSEMAILHMLSLIRNFPQILRNQEQRVWDRWGQSLLYEKKVGILGVGVIGAEIARKCKAFDMTVYGIDIVKQEVDSVDHWYGPEGLLEVMGEVDFFISVVPSTPETRGIFGAKELSAMKPTAFFINLGRGDAVVEEALLDALKTGRIAGAGLDVFWTTPLPEDHPLWGMKNVIITPHVGGKSDIYAQQTLPVIEENLRRFLGGERRELLNFVER